MKTITGFFLSFVVAGASVAVIGLRATPVSATTLEEARAQVVPWSGYWWPLRGGGILKPLDKYDRLTGSKAGAWELEHHPLSTDTPEWHGYCHAWAASAMMEKEPRMPRVARVRNPRPVELRVGDQKGLLAACHTCDVANVYGDRFGDREGSEDKRDLAPDRLWYLLKLYVKEQRVPLILDIEAGPEVWNYPVFGYRLQYSPHGDSGRQLAELSLLMADNGVRADYVGVKVRRHTYRFTFQLRNGSVAMGSGRWVGRSREDHPDFAWYPYVARGDNPEVSYDQVQRLLTGSDARPPEPAVEPAADAETEPTAEPTAEPDTEPATEPETGAETEPAAEPATEPETEVGTEPAVDPAIEPAPDPHADPVTDPRAGPAAEPGSQPVIDHHEEPATDVPHPQPLPVVISPMELVAIIAEKNSSFGLDVTVNRFDGGHYTIGETFTVRCAAEKSGYLYLFYLNDHGVLSLLYPRSGQDNRVPAQLSITIPDAKDLAFGVLGPAGTARVKALVSSRPLAVTGLVPVQRGQIQHAAATGQDNHRLVEPLCFRWHPTQRQQIQRLLHQYQRRETLERDALSGLDPQTLLGPFAQDEVAFYVEPLPRTN